MIPLYFNKNPFSGKILNLNKLDMLANDARKTADDVNSYSKDEDYLEDRVLDGIFMDILDQSSKGKYSFDYDKTVELTSKDLRYCREKLEELDYLVSVDYDHGIITISW